MTFEIDATAPRLPEEHEVLSSDAIAPILDRANLICVSVQDNDVERWLMSRAGQFIRNTGEDADRFYVVPPSEAWEFLNGFCEDGMLQEIVATGAFMGADRTPSP